MFTRANEGDGMPGEQVETVPKNGDRPDGRRVGLAQVPAPAEPEHQDTDAPPPRIDVAAAEHAMRALLSAFGMGAHEEIMRNTPRRMVQAYVEFFSPREFTPTVFPNQERYAELVLVRGIPFQSVCEHHFMPFVGTAHVGYIPGADVVGLSKLARAVELFSRRPQRQERLTMQIVEWLERKLQPRGVGVLMTAEHTCMTLRGALAGTATTVTSAYRGVLEDDPRYRADFHLLAGPVTTPAGR